MGWVRIDDCFDDHPKMIQAEPAIGAWVRGLAYCNRFLTDGFIPQRKALEFAGKKKLALLVDAVLWEPVPGGYRVHDYNDYQPTRAEVEAERAAAAARKATWKAKQNGGHNGTERRSERVPEHVRDAFGTPTPKPKPKPKNKQKQNSADKSAGAGAPTSFQHSVVGDGAQPPWNRALMPILRECGFAADDRDASLLRHMVVDCGISVERVEAAIRGLGMMRNSGRLSDVLGVQPDDQLNMRMLVVKAGQDIGLQPIWNEAEQLHYRELPKTAKGPQRIQIGFKT